MITPYTSPKIPKPKPGSCTGPRLSPTAGASTATAAVFSRVAVPDMLKAGYDKRLAAGVVAQAASAARFEVYRFMREGALKGGMRRE